MRIREVFKKGNYSSSRVIQFIILKKKRERRIGHPKTKQKIRLNIFLLGTIHSTRWPSMKNEAGCWDSNYSGGTGYIHENSSNMV